jgi:hypothetical protein
VDALLDTVKLFGMGYSWGGFESLIIPFDCVPYRTATQWAPGGPALRLHIGLENVADLKADLERARQRRPRPRVFQLLQLTLARLRRSVATGRLVCLSWAAMHRSDSAIFRFRLAMVFFDWPVEPAISPTVNRAVSKVFTASRFFLS